MPSRKGKEYIAAIESSPREIWIGGERISSGFRTHPAFRAMLHSMAQLYDLQYDPELKEEMTYLSPKSKDPVGMSFLQPKTHEDLVRRHRMMKHWAEYSGGMLGRTPDYLNSDLMALASAAAFFGRKDPRFGKNIQNYYEHVRENDLLMTHTLIHPQVNRAMGPSKQADPSLAARVVEKNNTGIVIRGARMLATLPLADLSPPVFPSTVIRGSPEDMPYSFAFGIPTSTKGLKFLCRESFAEKSTFDHPLASRFDEQDAVVIFDDVVVPWELVFLLEDVEAANTLQEISGGIVHMAHQVMVKNIAKTEFILGVVSMISDTIGITEFQHVQEKIAKVIMLLESLKAMVRASEADAELNQWGIMTPDFKPLNVGRNLYPRVYPQLRAVIQQLSASGLMALPTEADLHGEIRGDIDRYYQAKNTTSEEKIRLFRLAWDIAGSSFGSRQELYERFFFGDPVRMASNLYNWYDKEPYKERIRNFLHREDQE